MIVVGEVNKYFYLFREENEKARKREFHGNGFDEILEQEKEKLSAASHRIAPNNSGNISSLL